MNIINLILRLGRGSKPPQRSQQDQRTDKLFFYELPSIAKLGHLLDAEFPMLLRLAILDQMSSEVEEFMGALLLIANSRDDKLKEAANKALEEHRRKVALIS